MSASGACPCCAHRKLEEALKAMQTSLPLVSALHHPAMRPRHWKQLMKATGTHFSMDESFSLGALMRLGLHQHVDACSEIVDRAEKELVIEKALRKIEDAWAGLALAFSPYQVRMLGAQLAAMVGGTLCSAVCCSQETGVLQLVVDEVITEGLESDNLTLQNLSANKYVQVGRQGDVLAGRAAAQQHFHDAWASCVCRPTASS